MTNDGPTRHDNCVSPAPRHRHTEELRVLDDEEIIMLGLYEWLREEIELENAAYRENSEG